MTRRDWWQTFILVRVNRPNKSTPRAKPLSASNVTAQTLVYVD